MSDIVIVEDDFGIFPDPETPTNIKRFTMTNSSGFSAQVISYGAALTTLKVPDKNGILEDIVLGFDDIEGYLGVTYENPYFGASIGRTSNRIAKGQFTLDGKQYQLTLNDGANHLHGGIRGFDKRIFEGSINGSRVVFTYLSPDGEEGYPGSVIVTMSYEITTNNELILEYSAVPTLPTPIALTNHSYFNLSGQINADKQLYGHQIMINADSYTPVDEDLLITGEIAPVASTIYDLTSPKEIMDVLAAFPDPDTAGIDNNYCLNLDPGEEMNFAARLEHTITGRIMEIYTNQPGLQFYTGNFLPLTDPIIGKEGARYLKYGAVCLEAQNYPDAVNHPNFPNPFVRPGSLYSRKTIYRFSTTKRC